jgi:membrane protein implicated in regulation of membrane protease activity
MGDGWQWFQDNAWAAWLAAAFLLGLAELMSLDLVLLMLAGGALVGMLVSLTPAGVPVQILAAAMASISMLLLVRPNIVRRLHSGPDLRTGPAALVGREGFAVAEVTVHGGQVKLAGEVWSARPYDDDDVIPVGAKVEVFEIRGATAYVHEVPRLGS